MLKPELAARLPQIPAEPFVFQPPARPVKQHLPLLHSAPLDLPLPSVRLRMFAGTACRRQRRPASGAGRLDR